MQPEQNPYDFIMDPKQQKRVPGISFGSGKKKFLTLFILLSIVIVVIIAGFSLISSIGKVDNQDLIKVRAQQTELIRVIGVGQKNVSDIAVKNRLASLEASLASDGRQIAELLSGRNEIITKLQLSTLKDSEIDAALEVAKQDGTYDETLLEAIGRLSNNYYSSLKSSLADATTPLEKRLLQTAIDNLEATAN